MEKDYGHIITHCYTYITVALKNIFNYKIHLENNITSSGTSSVSTNTI